METFLFYLFGTLMLGAAAMTVASRSAVAAAVWLVFSFVCAAGVFALLAAPFLAILQILIYAGAIMVLFLFVIMMLQGPVLPAEVAGRSFGRKALLALPAAAIAVILISWAARGREAAFGAAPVTGTAAAVAELLLNRYLLAFELISIVLLVAIVGAMALGRKQEEQP
ncbi:MAG: NADH-quinone oxidoreductase subunit J [bacterium]|nr:NADH-quinone oxidoreductase subunit J [bacterium]MBK9303162.1 NADH-quinone oxidoreductase subunit J [bacterium]